MKECNDVWRWAVVNVLTRYAVITNPCLKCKVFVRPCVMYIVQRCCACRNEPCLLASEIWVVIVRILEETVSVCLSNCAPRPDHSIVQHYYILYCTRAASTLLCYRECRPCIYVCMYMFPGLIPRPIGHATVHILDLARFSAVQQMPWNKKKRS